MPVVEVVVHTIMQLVVPVVLAAVEMVEQTPLVQEIMVVVERQIQVAAVALDLEALVLQRLRLVVLEALV
jgi:hypothetical protein